MSGRAAVILAAVVGASPAAVRAAGPGQKGVSLTLWNENVNLTQLAASLADAAADGVDHVGVNVWWFQADIHATTIAPDFTRYSAGDASVAAVIDAVHDAGMAVMLKPLVDLSADPGHWRGQIVGGPTWFDGPGGYGDFIGHFADMAEAGGAEVFCVGTELTATAGQEADWRGLIADVRGRYSGELTYAANQGGSSVTAATIGWWDALDYFGIDAYYPLTGLADPTPAELAAAWAGRADQIGAWRDAIAPDKPVLFTEVGYRSWDGTNRAPYSCAEKGDANVDEAEQADCYEALFGEVWEVADWLEGVYWWNWEVDPSPTWEADNWYPLQGKPAEDVLAKYYAPHPGDANRDAAVDVLDLARLANNFGATGATWRDADFNGDGVVDVLDLAAIANNFGYDGRGGAGGRGTQVPEPALPGLLLSGAGGLLRRRSRQRARPRKSGRSMFFA